MEKFIIYFLPIGDQAIIKHVRTGLIRELNSSLGSKKYELKEVPGIHSENILQDVVKDCLTHDHAHLITTIGSRAAKIICEEVSKRKHPIPVVFSGAMDPVGLGLVKSIKSSGNSLTGVMMIPQKNTLPAQAILKVRPDIKTILVPYRPSLQGGRTHHNAKRVQLFFRNRDVTVRLYPLTEETIQKKQMAESMKQVDLVINLESGLFVNELDIIAEIAKEAGTPFWADGEEALKHGALCAVKTDFEYIGAVMAQQIYEILVNKILPTNLPTRVLPSSRRLEINDELAAQKGAVLTDELEVSIDKAFSQSKDLVSKDVLLVIPKPCCYQQPIASEITHRMRADIDTFFDYDKMIAWPEGNPKLDKAALVYFDQDAQGMDAIITLADRVGKKICDHFIKNNIKTPIITIDLQDEYLQEDWHRTAEQHGIEVARFITPKSPLLIQLDLLLTTKPNMKELNVILWGDNQKGGFLPLTQKRLKPLQQRCQQLGITCHLRMINEVSHFNQVEPYMKPASCWLFLDTNLPYAIVNNFADLCIKKNVVCAAGSLVWARKFPLNAGIDADKITRQSHPILKRITIEGRSPAYRKIFLPAEEYIHISVNQELCEQLGITFTGLDKLLLQNSLVPVDHALDTRALMQEIDSMEYYKIRKARAQKREALLQEPSAKKSRR